MSGGLDLSDRLPLTPIDMGGWLPYDSGTGSTQTQLSRRARGYQPWARQYLLSLTSESLLSYSDPTALSGPVPQRIRRWCDGRWNMGSGDGVRLTADAALRAALEPQYRPQDTHEPPDHCRRGHQG